MNHFRESIFFQYLRCTPTPSEVLEKLNPSKTSQSFRLYFASIESIQNVRRQSSTLNGLDQSTAKDLLPFRRYWLQVGVSLVVLVHHLGWYFLGHSHGSSSSGEWYQLALGDYVGLARLPSSLWMLVAGTVLLYNRIMYFHYFQLVQLKYYHIYPTIMMDPTTTTTSSSRNHRHLLLAKGKRHQLCRETMATVTFVRLISILFGKHCV